MFSAPEVLLISLLFTLMMQTVWLLRLNRLRIGSTKWGLMSSRSTHPISNEDTIYALSSGAIVKSGVAVIRISGPRSFDTLETLVRKPNSTIESKKIEPRYATLKRLYDPEMGDILDEALVIWFPGPNSFTGEDVVELQVHGSRAVISGVFDAFRHLDQKNPSVAGALRPANPGEFTRRAFERGKMDLTEVEGLSDLLASDTKSQRKQALKQIQGSMRKTYDGWRAALLRCLAHSEAVIDFGDDDREGDISDKTFHTLLPTVKSLHKQISTYLRDGKRGELIREGVKVAIAGPPNAGKSSLINALAKRPAAIVSPIAGTTRDVIEVRMDLNGISCIFCDTAGLRELTSDPIELEGMKRAKEAFKEAQLKVFVCDPSNESEVAAAETMLKQLLSEEVRKEDDEINGLVNEQRRLLLVLNKADLEVSSASQNILYKMIDTSRKYNRETASDIQHTFQSHIKVSCVQGNGIDELENLISATISEMFENAGGASTEGVLITRDRHRRHLSECLRYLDDFITEKLPMDIAAENLRLAMLELGKLTGLVDVDELLDIIFRDFCIGK